MKIAMILVSVSMALLTQMSHAREAALKKKGTGDLTSICKINGNPKAYVGKVVTISALYLTDSSNYEYLKDSKCSRLNILELGFLVPERDASVARFEQAQAAECRRKNELGLCILQGPVTVRGEIAQTKGAHLQPDAIVYVINLHSVITSWLKAKR
jgi:hypothetical protein